MVAQQGGEAGQERKGKQGRADEGQRKAEHVREEKIAVVHMGQQERHRDAHQHGAGQQRRVVQTPAPDKAEDVQQNQEAEGGGNAEICQKLRVHLRAVGEEGVNRGGIVVQPAADGVRLVDIQQQRVQKRPPRQDRGGGHKEVGQGKGEQVPPLDPPGEDEHQEHRQQEHGLQLEGKAQRGADHRPDGPALQGQRHAPKGKGGVDAVALAPVGPVQQHRGEQQGYQKAHQPRVIRAGRVPDEAQHPPGQEHIEQHGEQLDEIEVPDAGIGNQSEEIEVGDVVVPHAPPQGGNAAVVAVKLHPALQKILIVQRLVLHAQPPQQHRRRDGRGGEEQVRVFTEHPLPPQDDIGPRAQQEQPEILRHIPPPSGPAPPGGPGRGRANHRMGIKKRKENPSESDKMNIDKLFKRMV